jgi:hypothetical protein
MTALTPVVPVSTPIKLIAFTSTTDFVVRSPKKLYNAQRRVQLWFGRQAGW